MTNKIDFVERRLTPGFVLLLLIVGALSGGCFLDSPPDDGDPKDTNGIYDTFTSSGADTSTTTVFADYFYVRVSATEAAESMTTEDPGADIDAVILNQGGANITATGVELLTNMSVYENYKPRDVNVAGATIDAFDETDPANITASSTCNTSSDSFVSIGGTDVGEAAAIWTFPSGIENGDTLYVVEVGGCDTGSSTAGSEPYSVEISISTTVDANWQSLGSRVSDAPVTPFSVSGLPDVPLGN